MKTFRGGTPAELIPFRLDDGEDLVPTLARTAEELNLGTAAVVIAFLLIVGTGLRIALRTESPFEKLLAAGLTVIIGVQSFIIMAGVTRLFPLTGITLPFVSYGGSSLIANYVLLALLVRVSDSSATRSTAPAEIASVE